MVNKVCPVCLEGMLTEHIDYLQVGRLSCPLVYCVCDYCGSELTDVEQSRYNKYSFLNALNIKEKEIKDVS